MKNKDWQKIFIDINDKVRNNSPTLKKYLYKIEQQFIKITEYTKSPVIYYKMYKGHFGCIGTTHNAPIGQSTTGWSRTHIPEIGWSGRCQIVFRSKNGWKDESNLSFSEPSRYTCIHSGTGGYNGGNPREYKLNWDCQLFIKDLPLVYEQYMKFINDNMELIHMLGSKDTNDILLAEGIISGQKVYLKKLNQMVNILGNSHISHPINNLNVVNNFKNMIAPYCWYLMKKSNWSNRILEWSYINDYNCYGSFERKLV